MFVKNNPNIDFNELEQRGRLQLARQSSARIVAPPKALLSGARDVRSMSMTANSGRRPPVLQLVKSWVWCVLRLRRIREWAELGRDARAHALSLEQQMNAGRNSVLSALGEATEQLTAQSAAESARLDEEDRRSKAELARLDRDLSNLRREIMFQQRRLTRLVAPSGAVEASAVPDTVDGRLDAYYIAFEDKFRGSRADIKDRLRDYVEPIKIAGAGGIDKPILDIGCGRGEWLELLREEGLTAYGIDSNAMMVERSVQAGLDARHDDLLAHLHQLPDASRSAVTAFHVVEHLPLGVLIDFLDEVLRVLSPGGLLILETPNPETMKVGATTFYYDPTHRNPLPPLPLQFMVEHRGFSEVEVKKFRPFTQGLLESKTADAELLNCVLFGPQDYAVLARRG